MKIGFYSPYLDAFGGGERYVLTLASHWSQTNQVDVFYDNPKIVTLEGERFAIDTSKIHILPNIFRSNAFLDKLISTWYYDVLFVLSDGSIPWTTAKHNILHFQFPIQNLRLQKIKLFRYQTVVCNSEFTKVNLDRAAGAEAKVIYPPVDSKAFTTSKKTKSIISVGRFSSHYEVKKQHILIDAFKSGYDRGLFKGWELLFVGSLHPSDTNYFNDMKKKAKSYPVKFYENADFDTLKRLYSKSAIYWHAAGFGQVDPMLMEHFGITTVEAMAASCVPVVYGFGGQVEIVNHGKNGFLWNTVEELLQLSKTIMDDSEMRMEMASNAVRRASEFDQANFCKRYDDLLTDLIR